MRASEKVAALLLLEFRELRERSKQACDQVVVRHGPYISCHPFASGRDGGFAKGGYRFRHHLHWETTGMWLRYVIAAMANFSLSRPPSCGELAGWRRVWPELGKLPQVLGSCGEQKLIVSSSQNQTLTMRSARPPEEDVLPRNDFRAGTCQSRQEDEGGCLLKRMQSRRSSCRGQINRRRPRLQNAFRPGLELRYLIGSFRERSAMGRYC